MDAMERRENTSVNEPGQARMSNEDLIDRVGALFEQADQDGNGFLDRKEFKAVFTSLKEELGLSNKVIKQIMAEADEVRRGERRLRRATSKPRLVVMGGMRARGWGVHLPTSASN